MNAASLMTLIATPAFKHIHEGSWQGESADDAHLQMHAGKACSCSVPALTGFITLEALSGHWNLHTTAVL